MGNSMGAGGVMDIVLFVISILGIVLCVMWIFLPWILVAKMDRMIELLEGMSGRK